MRIGMRHSRFPAFQGIPDSLTTNFRTRGCFEGQVFHLNLSLGKLTGEPEKHLKRERTSSILARPAAQRGNRVCRRAVQCRTACGESLTTKLARVAHLTLRDN